MKIENKLCLDILNTFKDQDNIASATIVGSILDKTIDQISDIDIVVILYKLNSSEIENINNKLLSLEPSNYNLKKTFQVNDTFGPLKFDDEDTLVFHLMIYDVESHINHVIQSPFTCFDWERSELYIKKKLSEIYPTRKLMLSDFIGTRRGVDAYLDDLENKRIGFRKYEKNQSNNLIEKKQYFEMNKRHLVEYCFHIYRNTISNLIKILDKNNIKYFNDNFLNMWEKKLKKNYHHFSESFINISKAKYEKLDEEKSYISDTKKFLTDIKLVSNEIYEQSKKIILLRHFPTNENDGRFLGQKNDPSVLANYEITNELRNLKKLGFDHYSSPSKRAIETAEFLGLEIKSYEQNLQEFNYGKAEGMYFEQLIQNYPNIQESINNNEDFTFPGGENYSDVFRRTDKYIKGIKKNSVLITHQGPIRTVLGNFFDVPIHHWYKINIPFGTKIELLNINNEIYVNINRKLFKDIFGGFYDSQE
jgi:broad specificity phosphatase PhoE/predicted nucleotidyltransferase